MNAIFKDLILCPMILIASGCGSGVKRIDYSVEKLTKTLKDKDPQMRYWAAESLGRYGSEANVAIPDLTQALEDESELVRMGAAYALGERGAAAETARPALQQATKDSDSQVREAAAYALKQIATAKAKPPARR
jgi:HEAT repeat protein